MPLENNIQMLARLLDAEFRSVSNSYAKYLELSIKESINNQTSPDKIYPDYMSKSTIISKQGKRFMPLSPRYVRWKAKHSSSKKILILKDNKLYNIKASVKNNMLVVRFPDRRLSIWHQFGTKRGLPARPHVGYKLSYIEKIRKSSQAILNRVIEKWRRLQVLR